MNLFKSIQNLSQVWLSLFFIILVEGESDCSPHSTSQKMGCFLLISSLTLEEGPEGLEMKVSVGRHVLTTMEQETAWKRHWFRIRTAGFSSVQSLSRVWLCSPGFPVYHQLPELAQTHVHRVGNAIQPSHPLSSPSPTAFNLFQHQGLFQWVSSSHQVAKVLQL